ncbi:MAG: HEPN domain-containing protein [Methylococcaceae bacterium]
MKNSNEIKQLAYERLSEAQILCNNGKYDGAFYLAGYSIELMLKAKICQHLGIDNLFDKEGCQIPSISDLRKVVETHNINLLLLFSGLEQKFRIAKATNIKLKDAYLFFTAITGNKTDWNEQVRYLPIGSKTEQEVREFINLLHDEEGLLKWIEQN